jgi:hypothetical protein
MTDLAPSLPPSMVIPPKSPTSGESNPSPQPPPTAIVELFSRRHFLREIYGEIGEFLGGNKPSLMTFFFSLKILFIF